ncbi:MAG: adenylate/guanylate cyclase domain-containing protein [Planctomycetota bacterium]|nr:adenylate/guanylate cyclase domain-containing protein [Planctomycetota bacterium]
MIVTAQGIKSTDRCVVEIDAGTAATIGRTDDCQIPVPWDAFISKHHAKAKATADTIELRCLETARNTAYFAGKSVQHCVVHAGEHFIIGETTFRVTADETPLRSPDSPFEEVVFNHQQLQQVRFRDADRRLEVLTHLPEVIRDSRVDAELYIRLVNLILAGVTHAEATAVVRLSSEGEVDVLHWDRRRETAGRFRPSARLVRDVFKKQQSVLHVWEAVDESEHDYTKVAEFDWAFCSPVVMPEASWGLYVAGRSGPTELSAGDLPLQADVKFVEFVAEIVRAVQRTSHLERQTASLRQFLPPTILASLDDAGGDHPTINMELLEPRECTVTVLFCDLRGFSQRAEEWADNLRGLLDRVSQALDLMSEQILLHRGVTGDFLGDAALGFWGWPFESEESTLDACRAALGIRKAFADRRGRKDHPLADFEMGIGIARGTAVAGKIGTSGKMTVTVFGPPVNLASRLESATKQLRVPILLDSETARIVQERMPREEGRIRKLAQVVPYGMELPVIVSELVPPASDFAELSDRHIQEYERGVEHFIAGRWEEAHQCLHKMPASDRAQDFLSMLIAQHNRRAPANWDGVVRLSNK